MSNTITSSAVGYPLRMIERRLGNPAARERANKRLEARRIRTIAALGAIITNTDNAMLRQVAVEWLKHIADEVEV